MKTWHIYRNGRPTAWTITPPGESLWPGQPIQPERPTHLPIAAPNVTHRSDQAPTQPIYKSPTEIARP